MPKMKEGDLEYWAPDEQKEEMEFDTLVSLRLLTRNTRLVEARHVKGVTQRQMAQEIGMSHPRLSHIENLKFVPNDDDRETIAVYLGQPIDYLFPDVLMRAIEGGVFERRQAQLAEPEIISLTEGQRLRLAYDGETKLIEDITRKEIAENINEILGTLKPRERIVLEERFGFDSQSKSLQEVSGRLNLSRERIRQIEAKALRKLRYSAQSRKLESYLE